MWLEAAPDRMKLVDRALVLAAPVFCLTIAAEIWDGVLKGPQWIWNDVRLARGFALRYGYPLYPARDAHAPIIGTMHGPVSHVLYSALAFLKDPTRAMLAGCMLSCLLYLAPLAWIHLRMGGPGRGGRLGGAYGFGAASAVLLATGGSRYAIVNIHVDACALCCAMLAAGILAVGKRPLPWSALAVSAGLSMLAVASKQTLAPIPIALACFLVAADGWAAFWRYVAAQVVAGLAIAGAILASFRPPADLLFNTYVLATHRPRTLAAGARMLEGVATLRNELAPAVAPLVFLMAVLILDRAGGIRERISSNRWLVFAAVALFQTPLTLRAWSSAGAADNHLGVVTLFVTLAATAGLTALWRRDGAGLAPRALMAAVLLSRIYIPWSLPASLRAIDSNPTATAFRYDRRFPGRAYFPLNPLAVLLAEGKLTHFDYALSDREEEGFPVSEEQFACGLPAGFELVAYPPQFEPRAQVIQRWLKGLPRGSEPGLEGWQVYRVR